MLSSRDNPRSSADDDTSLASSSNHSASPARKVITRSKQTIRTAYPSTKSGKTNDCESGLESKVAACLELSPGVMRWRPQPFTLRLTVDGESKKYTPDFHVTLRNEKILIIEVKPFQKCLEELVSLKLVAAHYHLERRGVSFGIVTELDVGTNVLHQNLNLLRYYARVECKKTEIKSALAFISISDCATIFELESAGYSKSFIYSLLANNKLHTDLTIALSPLSIITLPQENDNEKCFFHSRSAINFE